MSARECTVQGANRSNRGTIQGAKRQALPGATMPAAEAPTELIAPPTRCHAELILLPPPPDTHTALSPGALRLHIAPQGDSADKMQCKQRLLPCGFTVVPRPEFEADEPPRVSARPSPPVRSSEWDTPNTPVSSREVSLLVPSVLTTSCLDAMKSKACWIPPQRVNGDLRIWLLLRPFIRSSIPGASDVGEPHHVI